MPFPNESINIPISLLDGSGTGDLIPATIRDATNDDALLWENDWLPKWSQYNLPQKTWEISSHIRKSIYERDSPNRRSLVLVAECNDNIEAIMSLTFDDKGENAPDKRKIVYVEYIGSCPENEPSILKTTGQTRRTYSAPQQLIVVALMISQQVDLGGWIGLDSKIGADKAYKKWGMNKIIRREISGTEYYYFEAGPDEFDYIQKNLDKLIAATPPLQNFNGDGTSTQVPSSGPRPVIL